MKLLYLDDYKRDEEDALRQLGVESARVKMEDAIGAAALASAPKGRYIVRGPRISGEQYERLWQEANAAGLDLSTSPQAYRIGLNFREQYAALREYSPTAVILDAATEPSAVLQALLDDGIRFPVFLRSDLESAAKYVGVEGCVVSRPDLSAVAETMENLRKHVQGFTTLIFKEVVELAKHEESGESVEYRAIGVGGMLVAFDLAPEGQRLPSPESLGLSEFASGAFGALAIAGGDGGLFLDVALSSSRSPLVVECKNLLNGSIRALAPFATAIKTL